MRRLWVRCLWGPRIDCGARREKPIFPRGPGAEKQFRVEAGSQASRGASGPRPYNPERREAGMSRILAVVAALEALVIVYLLLNPGGEAPAER